jgi:hypothetical protein
MAYPRCPNICKARAGGAGFKVRLILRRVKPHSGCTTRSYPDVVFWSRALTNVQ